ncbi:hypothetical protein H4R35_006097 [Dimargaris xerosporica]|nr:hypothetical protein H4R35_006097 [Dimargaris xerosporica]
MPTVKDVSRCILQLLTSFDKVSQQATSRPGSGLGLSTSGDVAIDPDAQKQVAQFLDSPEFYALAETLDAYASQHPALPGPSGLTQPPSSRPTDTTEGSLFRPKLLTNLTSQQTLPAGDAGTKDPADAIATHSRGLGPRGHPTASVTPVNAVVTPRNLSPVAEENIPTAAAQLDSFRAAGGSPFAAGDGRAHSPTQLPAITPTTTSSSSNQAAAATTAKPPFYPNLALKEPVRSHSDNDDTSRLSNELLHILKQHVLPLLSRQGERWENVLSTELDREQSKPRAPLPNLRHSRYDKIVVFFRAFHRLLPSIGCRQFLADWWQNVFMPMLALPNNQRVIEIELRHIVLDLLDSVPVGFTLALPHHTPAAFGTPDAEWAWVFAHKVVHQYLKTCNEELGYSEFIQAQEKGSGELNGLVPGEKSRTVVNYERILEPFGHARPKALYTLLNQVMVADTELEFAALKFLSVFTSQLPNNKYIITETPLLETVVGLLETTTSFELMDVGTNVLLFVLPCLGQHLADWLPRFLYILGRRLAWLRSPSPSVQALGASDVVQIHEYLPLSTSTILLFSYLYGPFPFNTTQFLQAPAKYIRSWLTSRDASETDTARYPTKPFELSGFYRQAEQLLRTHVYHPNLLRTSGEQVIRVIQTTLDAADSTGTATEDLTPPFVVPPFSNDPTVVNQKRLPEYLELQNFATRDPLWQDPAKFIDFCVDLQVECVRRTWHAYNQQSAEKFRAAQQCDSESGAVPPRTRDATSGATVPLFTLNSPNTLPNNQPLAHMDQVYLPPQIIATPDAAEQPVPQGAGGFNGPDSSQQYTTGLLSRDAIQHINARPAQLAHNIVYSYAYAVADSDSGTQSIPLRSTQRSPAANAPASFTEQGGQAALYRLANQLELERHIAAYRLDQIGQWKAERIQRAEAEVLNPFLNERARYYQRRFTELRAHHTDSIDQEHGITTSRIGQDRHELERSHRYRDQLRDAEAMVIQLREQMTQLEQALTASQDRVRQLESTNFRLNSWFEKSKATTLSAKDYHGQIEKLTALLMVSKSRLDHNDALETQYQELQGTCNLLQTQIDASQRELTQLQQQLADKNMLVDQLRQQIGQLDTTRLATEPTPDYLSLPPNDNDYDDGGKIAGGRHTMDSTTDTYHKRMARLERELEQSHQQMAQVVDENAQLRTQMLNLQCQLQSSAATPPPTESEPSPTTSI